MLGKQGVIYVTADQCQYNLLSRDNQGEGLVKKATGFMTNAPCIAMQLQRRCPNKPGRIHHRHVTLEGGRTKAAQVYIYADARSLLRLAAHARSRTIMEVQPGMIVYYLRRGKGAKKPTYRGPARVLAVEPPEAGNECRGTSVVWLSHAGVLIRAAPEHLWMATPVEVSVETAVRGDAAPPGIAI